MYAYSFYLFFDFAGLQRLCYQSKLSLWDPHSGKLSPTVPRPKHPRFWNRLAHPRFRFGFAITSTCGSCFPPPAANGLRACTQPQSWIFPCIRINGFCGMGSSCTTSFMGFIRRRCLRFPHFFRLEQDAPLLARGISFKRIGRFHNVPFRLLGFAHFFRGASVLRRAALFLLKSSRPIATRFLAGSGTSINRGRPFQ